MKQRISSLVATATLSICLSASAMAYICVNPDNSGGSVQKPTTQTLPAEDFGVHNVGKIAMTIGNNGTFGTGFLDNPQYEGDEAPSCQFPINSKIEYLFCASIWIGAIVGLDTSVSVGADGWIQVNELFPDAGTAGQITSRSSSRAKPDYDPNAVSDQDFSCAFSDTFTTNIAEDPTDNRPHLPLNVAIQLNTYAWSYDYAEDFILMDYKITNIGRFPIKKMYIGLYVDADVHAGSVNSDPGYDDDLCGFRRAVDAPAGSCFTKDTINIAWIADNDGDPDINNWTWPLTTSTPAVTGTRVLRTPFDTMTVLDTICLDPPDCDSVRIDTVGRVGKTGLSYSFNWWMSQPQDFGPRMAGTEEKPFRPFPSGGLGTPSGDLLKYYTMSNGEFDYDQLFSAVSHVSEGFLPVDVGAKSFADGGDTRYLLSFGPFNIAPNATVPITTAYIAGDNFHVNPKDWANNFSEANPDIVYALFNFDDLGKNAVWASKIFDNPGVDTDTDGYAGKYCIEYVMRDTFYVDTFIVCDSILDPPTCDTTYDTTKTYRADSTMNYYTGDGVPDFRGAMPPMAPLLRVVPEFGKVTLLWNGQLTETRRDNFSGALDFEGYRVYYGEDNRLTDFVLLSSYDIEDYKVFVFDDSLGWQQIYDQPLTLDSLRSKYGHDFDPKLYNSQTNDFIYGDSNFYFLPQDWNQFDLSNPSLIHKVYPNASKYNRTDTTEEGYLRYYEYEYTIDNLQPSKPYYFAVTAFDYGSVKADMGSLESSVLSNAVQTYPLPTADAVEENASPVMIYPNPYRIDGNYANIGYENRDRTHSVERARRINFVNLPGNCTIRIFTLAGDLIKEISHTNGTSEDYWDVISRNTQPVVTGIYIWHIESDMGEQIGKLVIIK